MIFKRKPGGPLKARKVLWGHREFDKDGVRGNAPTRKPDSMRLQLSLVGAIYWIIRELDDKVAYSEAKGFYREFFVLPAIMAIGKDYGNLALSVTN